MCVLSVCSYGWDSARWAPGPVDVSRCRTFGEALVRRAPVGARHSSSQVVPETVSVKPAFRSVSFAEHAARRREGWPGCGVSPFTMRQSPRATSTGKTSVL
eukprot:2322337-Prymnesium_polylepis.1